MAQYPLTAALVLIFQMKMAPDGLLKPQDMVMLKKTENWVNPVNGTITSSCGARRNPVKEKEEYHDGLDIAVAENTDARAVKSGVVTEVRKSATFGNLVKFQTDDGYVVMYAHLNRVLVKKGDKIKQGDIIAKTGNTGLSTGPHLHYSVWKGDMLMNPMQFVNALAVTKDVRAEYIARGETPP